MRTREHARTSSLSWLKKGLRDGFPICMGYFAVGFAMGIAAKRISMNWLQAGLMSAGMVASAGEYAALMLLASQAGVLEMISTCVVVNLRYFLMSCALSQKLSPELPLFHRFFLAQGITDEMFALNTAVEGYLTPAYSYGMMIVSIFGWTLGTVLGVLAGNILPAQVVASLSVSLYGMFLAILVPPARKNAFIGCLVAVSMILSWLFSALPYLNTVSTGFKVIILTILVAGTAAFIRPLEDEPEKVPADSQDLNSANNNKSREGGDS